MRDEQREKKIREWLDLNAGKNLGDLIEDFCIQLGMESKEHNTMAEDILYFIDELKEKRYCYICKPKE